MKAETVMPWTRSPLRAVTIVTPVAQRASACLKVSALDAHSGSSAPAAEADSTAASTGIRRSSIRRF